ncbi:hypothetical protein COO91_04129 [Nostoc flagelliforme CCNUN1]|uniref:Uncharacterized protein n=1 Tax=Nostoc flagelliforme CCNUN1 TaxID=2038116 RepID=A0A2K8SRQ7_9NOSO|nr:hypothetical protein COO91_04129 [Nostoc flagelliforme CCNUN1]
MAPSNQTISKIDELGENPLSSSLLCDRNHKNLRQPGLESAVSGSGAFGKQGIASLKIFRQISSNPRTKRSPVPYHFGN